ncbi:MAG: hypothetical protein IH937_01575 [Acidobacteria bacterium]|nr:hypothetical protein [Acidobacteriota bacterium]
MEAILRKAKCTHLEELSEEELDFWKRAYAAYIRKLQRVSITSVVLDYDGTLCDHGERYTGPCAEIRRELVRLLETDILVGVATGRGKSVRRDLRRIIPKKFWERILIGYYNGADLGWLNDSEHPDSSSPLDPGLTEIKARLDDHKSLRYLATYECRPKQITVEPHTNLLWQRAKSVLFDAFQKSKVNGIHLVESSHSMDVLAPGVSKLNLVKACEKSTRQVGTSTRALCIGDKGEWPGNDYELLSTPYSLSVDSVSPDPLSCWNIGPVHWRGVQSTIAYLKSISGKRGQAQFRWSKKRKR